MTSLSSHFHCSTGDTALKENLRLWLMVTSLCTLPVAAVFTESIPTVSSGSTTATSSVSFKNFRRTEMDVVSVAVVEMISPNPLRPLPLSSVAPWSLAIIWLVLLRRRRSLLFMGGVSAGRPAAVAVVTSQSDQGGVSAHGEDGAQYVVSPISHMSGEPGQDESQDQEQHAARCRHLLLHPIQHGQCTHCHLCPPNLGET
ncbi:hypothetical protein INR49_003978 [Caranx melampygus]|nr:hypothetical protein INR49_003978 [Caranx melampygus]